MASLTKPRLFDRLVDKLINKRGREPLPIHFHWRRIYIFPSKAGLFLFAIWGVMLLAGLNFNNNMALMLVFFIFGIAHIALYQTFFNIKDIRLMAVDAAPVFLGDDVEFVLGLKADKARFDVSLNDAWGKEVKVNLKRAETTYLKFFYPSEKRGWQHTPRLKVYSRYPLGLFTAWTICRPQAQVLVYPKPEQPCPDFPYSGGDEGFKYKQDQGEDINSIRDYRPGDPVRDIAWKKSAQQDNTLVKEYKKEQGTRLEFDYNTVRLAGVEAKLSRLTAWIIRAEQLGVDYKLVLPGFQGESGTGQQHYKNCLQALALFGEQS